MEFIDKIEGKIIGSNPEYDNGPYRLTNVLSAIWFSYIMHSNNNEVREEYKINISNIIRLYVRALALSITPEHVREISQLKRQLERHSIELDASTISTIITELDNLLESVQETRTGIRMIGAGEIALLLNYKSRQNVMHFIEPREKSKRSHRDYIYPLHPILSVELSECDDMQHLFAPIEVLAIKKLLDEESMVKGRKWTGAGRYIQVDEAGKVPKVRKPSPYTQR